MPKLDILTFRKTNKHPTRSVARRVDELITQKTNGIRMRSISVLSFILLSFCIIIGCQKKISTTQITTPEVFFNQKPVRKIAYCQDFADQDRKNMTTDDKGLRFDVEMVKATDVGIKHKGKQLLILGTAENAHAGAIVNGIYLEDVKSWPEDLLSLIHI